MVNVVNQSPVIGSLPPPMPRERSDAGPGRALARTEPSEKLSEVLAWTEPPPSIAVSLLAAAKPSGVKAALCAVAIPQSALAVPAKIRQSAAIEVAAALRKMVVIEFSFIDWV